MKKKLTQNVNKDKMINDLPKVSPNMSSWLSRWCNYQSSNNGCIVPIYYSEVLPGERRSVKMSMISHTTTPVAPIFPAQYTEFRAFLVPLRLCADLLNGYKTRKSPFVKVFGEDNANASSDIVVPLAEQTLPSFTSDHQFIKDVSEFYGAYSNNNNVFDSLDLIDYQYDQEGSIITDFNYLNLAAYELIYQRHYRNENFESSTESPLYRLLFDAYNADKASVSLNSDFDYEVANREKDYFTGMKPFTQKGDPVRVPVGDRANVYGTGEQLALIGRESGAYPVRLANDAGTVAPAGIANANIFNGSSDKTLGSRESLRIPTKDEVGDAVTMYADLQNATGISIEELRLLIKTQEMLEKDAMYGSLFAESLNAHFGTCPIDLTLQDPLELKKVTVTSHMQAIFQTSATKDETSILGTIGANSTTQTDDFEIVPEFKCEEHSILMICAVHKLQNVYDSAYFKPKFLFKKARFDFFTPELNDLGFQPVSNKEMRTASGTAGFNEAYAEYRYNFNKVHGALGSDFPYWAPSISNEYSSASLLYKEDTAILDKALSIVSSTAPQFYDAFGFEEKVTKPMSLHSIPGFDGVI